MKRADSIASSPSAKQAKNGQGLKANAKGILKDSLSVASDDSLKQRNFSVNDGALNGASSVIGSGTGSINVQNQVVSTDRSNAQPVSHRSQHHRRSTMQSGTGTRASRGKGNGSSTNGDANGPQRKVGFQNVQ